jgi:hypothetical protein
MKKNNATQIAIFLTFSCVTLTTMMLALRFSISLYVFFIKGKFLFGCEDFIYSAKAGLAAGMPLGIGSWVLTKIEERNKK